MSGSAWQDTVPLVAVHHEVFTPTALGHRGGPPVRQSPVTIWDVVDAAEGYLDEHGLQRPHLAGNSMGGFVALELARRGRAESVCAFSPGGLWSDALRGHVMKSVRRNVAMGRITRGIARLLMKSPTLRQRGMRDVAWHGDRISAARAAEIAKDARRRPRPDARRSRACGADHPCRKRRGGEVAQIPEPGFRMPNGSNACLIRRLRSITSGPR